MFAKQYFNTLKLLTIAVGNRHFDFDRALLVADRPVKGCRERRADLSRCEKLKSEGDAVKYVSLAIRLDDFQQNSCEWRTAALTTV